MEDSENLSDMPWRIIAKEVHNSGGLICRINGSVGKLKVAESRFKGDPVWIFEGPGLEVCVHQEFGGNQKPSTNGYTILKV